MARSIIRRQEHSLKKWQSFELNSLATTQRLGPTGIEVEVETTTAIAGKGTGRIGSRGRTFLPQAAPTRAAKVAAAASSRRRRREATKSGIVHLRCTFLSVEGAASLQRHREGGASI